MPKASAETMTGTTEIATPIATSCAQSSARTPLHLLPACTTPQPNVPAQTPSPHYLRMCCAGSPSSSVPSFPSFPVLSRLVPSSPSYACMHYVMHYAMHYVMQFRLPVLSRLAPSSPSSPSSRLDGRQHVLLCIPCHATMPNATMLHMSSHVG